MEAVDLLSYSNAGMFKPLRKWVCSSCGAIFDDPPRSEVLDCSCCGASSCVTLEDVVVRRKRKHEKQASAATPLSESDYETEPYYEEDD